MAVFVTVIGGDKLDRKLKTVPAATKRMLRKQIAAAAIAMVTDIKDNMLRQAKTGRVYKVDSVSHQASAPGEYPAVLTTALINGVTFEIISNGMDAVVGTNVMHGVHLEFGTKNVDPRPWLQPSYNKVIVGKWQPVINQLLKKAMIQAAKR